MNQEAIDRFHRVKSQLHALYTEISLLSKKKEDGPINKFKLKFINALLSEANAVLGEDFLPYVEFQQFDEDELPTNSDVVMILAQYEGALDLFKSAKTYYDQTKHSTYWEAEKGKQPIKA